MIFHLIDLICFIWSLSIFYLLVLVVCWLSQSPTIIVSSLTGPDVLEQVMQCGRRLWWMSQMYLQPEL
jgi:hypothetical protein